MATQNSINVGVVAGGGNTYTFPAATDTLVGRISTDTLTNKTLTSPVIGTSILDTNGNTMITFTATASAVNFLNIKNNSSGNVVELSAASASGNVSLQLTPRATGQIISNGPFVPSVSATLALGTTSLQWTNLFLSTGGVINWNNGNTTLTQSAGNLTSNVPITAPNIFNGYTTTATAAGTTTLTVTSTYQQYFTGVTTQTVTLPVATTLVNGFQFFIVNNSTGAVTIQTSGANSLVVLAAGTAAYVTCINTAGGTGVASWSFWYAADTVASAKKLTVSNTLTLAGTDATTMTFPTTSATIARTDAANTFTGVQTFSSAPVLSTSTITVGGSANTFQAVADTVVYRATTDTLTNKNVTRRLVTVSGPGATPTTTVANVDIANFTALATAITSMSTNLVNTGAVDGQLLEFRFTDNATARAITWGASFGATTVALPTTTVISTMLRVLFEYNGTIWQCIATA